MHPVRGPSADLDLAKLGRPLGQRPHPLAAPADRAAIGQLSERRAHRLAPGADDVGQHLSRQPGDPDLPASIGLGANVALTSSGAQQIGATTPGGTPGTYLATITATSTPGTATVTAEDPGVTGTATLTQSAPPQSAPPPPSLPAMPTIQIDTPADGGIYLLHQHLGASYVCTDPLGLADILSCAGPNRLGARIDTNELGTHAFAVTAVNRAG